MRVLILGGGVFLGWHIADVAAGRGWQVTSFRRGTTPATMPAGVETVFGDRRRDLARLEGRTWDIVYDCCGYRPEVVAQSCETLLGAVGRYCFVSSVLAYADLSAESLHETMPAHEVAVDAGAELNASNYGPLKAACEREVRASLGTKASIVRPGYLIGPRDRSARMARWVRRSLRGGDVLLPEPAGRPWQFIDVRDAAELMASDGVVGTEAVWNVAGPASVSPGLPLLHRVLAHAGTRHTITACSTDTLRAAGAEAILDQADWAVLPETERGSYAMNVDAALAAGLRIRPLETTLADIHAEIGLRRSGPGSLADGAEYDRLEALTAARLNDTYKLRGVRTKHELGAT